MVSTLVRHKTHYSKSQPIINCTWLGTDYKCWNLTFSRKRASSTKQFVTASSSDDSPQQTAVGLAASNVSGACFSGARNIMTPQQTLVGCQLMLTSQLLGHQLTWVHHLMEHRLIWVHCWRIFFLLKWCLISILTLSYCLLVCALVRPSKVCEMKWGFQQKEHTI